MRTPRISPLTSLEGGSVVDWAITLTLILGVLILLSILVSRLLYRGRQAYEGSVLWVHLVALGILPLCLWAFGSFATLEHAKEARFCVACHDAMQTYYDDMQNARSEALAALHFQDRFAPETECYSCHANYGLHGNFKAKMAGFRDLYTYVTNQYRHPLIMHEPFDNALCLKCHNGARRFMAVPIHLDEGQLSADLWNGHTQCIQCHGPAHAVRKRRPPGRPGSTG